MSDRFPRPKKGDIFVVLNNGAGQIRVLIPKAEVTKHRKATVDRMMKRIPTLLKKVSR